MSQRMGPQAHRWVLNELDSHLPSSLRVKKMPETVGPRAQSEAVETVPGDSRGQGGESQGQGLLPSLCGSGTWARTGPGERQGQSQPSRPQLSCGAPGGACALSAAASTFHPLRKGSGSLRPCAPSLGRMVSLWEEQRGVPRPPRVTCRSRKGHSRKNRGDFPK